jgi:cytoskeletal protein CcmA (bactofilin family)
MHAAIGAWGGIVIEKERSVFGREKRPVSLDNIEVLVGSGANISGDLECDGIVKVEGIYQGSIKTASSVIIGERAKVDAEIEAQNVSVSGQVKGSIVAKERLEILSSGRVWADVTVSSFLLDDGGKLHGGLKMFGAGPAPESFDVPEPAVDKAEEQDVEVEVDAGDKVEEDSEDKVLPASSD